ncbi:EAL domain-containing protein [Sulfurovum sp.]|uniref:EAL domain-containing protein n=1 Tax=Sulfurovum sp. TaxID=1969726 RepID=UPI00356693A2
MRNMKYFILFSLLILLIISYKTYEQYKGIEYTQKLIVLKESESLANFISSFRQTYQDAFLNNNIDVDEKTIHLLPIKTISEISDRFSSSVQGDILIRTVSDRPRNIDNIANDFELDMIQYFRKHPNEKQKFLQKDDAFYYTQPLRIKESCLQCHGERENAILSIRDKYTNAYDYKLGEIHGLLNIKIKERDLFADMYADFTNTLISAIILYIVCLTMIYLLMQRIRRKDKKYAKKLEADINIKIDELKKQKEAFETLFEKSNDGVLILDDGKFIQCNENILKMLHYKSKKDLLNVSPSQLSPELQPDGRSSYEKAKEILSLAIKNNGHQFEWVHTKSNGEDFLVEVTLTPITLNNRKVFYVVWRDISDEKEAQIKLLEQKEILYHQAHHDALTGLPNRVLFNDRLEHGIELAKRNRTKFALFFIDLDYFKQINDSLGHQVGDKVLIAVTERLKAKIRKEDTLARLSGDEFTVIMEDINTIEDVSLLAQKIQKVLAQPIHIDGHTLYISCSMGISIYPKDCTAAKDLIKNADAAMYKAKQEGKNNFQFYSPEMTEFSLERMMMKNSLRQAIDDEEFIIHYQPQVDVNSGKLIGTEALIRWEHPTMGLLLPEKFLPLAKETALIVELDQWVMTKAMRQIYAWHEAGLNPGTLALNLSMRQLRNDDFIQIIQENIKIIGFKPEWLELEVNEGQIMEKPLESIAKLEQISKMGIKITIDDFGTGYSSLAYLKRLPVDKLKIDRSFVVGIPEDKEDMEIVKAIIALANSLGIEIVAEGVETAVQKNFLLESGCHYIQGHYYCEALSAEQIEKKCLGIK